MNLIITAHYRESDDHTIVRLICQGVRDGRYGDLWDARYEIPGAQQGWRPLALALADLLTRLSG